MSLFIGLLLGISPVILQATQGDLRYASSELKMDDTQDDMYNTENKNNSDINNEIVTGRVIDASNDESLPGVNILVKGTTTGTATDLDGNFSIEVPSLSDTLVFSYIGYIGMEVPIDGNTQFDIEMELDIAQAGEELVVVGFGKQQRNNVSGAVDQISARDLESRSISSTAEGLQGMIPNLNIDYTEGAPGSDPNINIRGFTSINGGSPLILIDNIPAEARELTRLDPKDVESISVLKDASSAAIYGARAAFGVILVETKHGSTPGVNINFSSRTSWDKPTILPDKVSDPYIYQRWQDNATSATPWDYVNFTDEEYAWAKERSEDPDGTSPVREDPNNPGTWQYMGDRDWTNYFLNEYGMSTNNTISLDGSTEQTRFYLSASHDSQDGALQLADDHFERWSVRSNVDYSPYDWLTIGNKTNINYSERSQPSYIGAGNEDDDWTMWELYDLEPMGWDKNPDGTWANTDVGQIAAQLTEGGRHSDGRETFQTSFNANLDLIQNILSVNADYTIRNEQRNYDWDERRYSLGHGPDDVREHGSTSAWRNRTAYDYQVFNVYTNLNLNYGDHAISSIAGFNQEFNEYYQVETEVGNLISSQLPSLSLAQGDPTVSDYYEGWAVRGLFGRLNYTFDNKYILEFNGRFDGSSRFPDGNRWGFFPSASAAWRIDQENFMSQFDWLEMLKPRVSYGTLGNQDVDTFGYMPTMNSYSANYLVDNSRPLSISAPGMVSSNYRWEEVSTTNFGLDVDMLDNRLMVEGDYYIRETKGMLTLGRELPAVLGTSEPEENAADLETKGWELSVHYRDNLELLGDRFSFGARFTLADSRAWITQFDNPENFLDQYYEGQEIGDIYGLQYEGLFQSEEEVANHADQSDIVPWGVLDVVPGWPKFKDLNDDGAITAGSTVDNPEDLSVIGNSQARYRFGFDMNFGWKNFDMRAFFQGVGKKDFYPQHYMFWGFYQQPYSGGYEHLLDFYRGEDDSQELMEAHSQAYIDAGLAHANTDGKYPVMQAWLTDVNTPGIGRIANDGFMLDASYLRLKNLTIGYTLSQSVTSRIGIQRLRVYLSGENLAEWSEISDIIDPEAITDNGYGYRYPFQRRFSLGIDVNF
ncbi:MAG: TonB-dependent receptor [Balneolales bacterium]